MENIIGELWNHVEKAEDKESKKVYNWLNHDNLNAVILDRGVFWLESMNSGTAIPNYVYDYIKEWGINKGYQYLYDLKAI